MRRKKVKEAKLYCPSCKKDFDEHDSLETGCCPVCGGKGEVKNAVPDRPRGKSKGKKKDGPGTSKKRVKRGKAGAGNGKAPTGLKYPFDSLEKGQSFTIPDADKPAGKVTVFQNVKVLCYEFGKRHGLKFKVKRTDDGQVECTRIK